MRSLNFADSLGADLVSAANTEHALETYRRLTAAGYGDTSEEYRPDLAMLNYGPEYFGAEYYAGDYYGQDQFGGFWGSIKKGVSGVAKGVSGVVKSGVSTALAPVRLTRDIAQGKNILKSVRAQAETVVRNTRDALPMAASIVSVVPGVGSVVSSGLSAASALSQGKSLREIAEDAAMGAIPGGALVKSGLRAGINVARGQNVLQSVAREGVQYARSQLPGGQLAQQGLTAATQIARGQNVLRSVSPLAQQLVKSPMVKVGSTGAALQFTRNLPAKAMAATTAQVVRAAQSTNPSVFNAARQVVSNTQREARAGNPGASIAARTIQAAIAQRIAQLMPR